MLSFIGKTPVSDDGYCENYNIFQRVAPLLQWVKDVQDRIAKEVSETKIKLLIVSFPNFLIKSKNKMICARFMWLKEVVKVAAKNQATLFAPGVPPHRLFPG